MNRKNREWRERNHEHWKANIRNRYANDPDFRRRQSEGKKTCYINKRDEYRAKNKANRLANLKKRQAKRRADYAINKKSEKASMLKWRQNHPGKIAEYSHHRRAIVKLASIGTDRKAYVAYMQWAKTEEVISCRWCGRPTFTTIREHGKRPIVRRHVDHLTPLARHGKHCVTNLCISCPTCNNRKFTKTPEEFLALAS